MMLAQMLLSCWLAVAFTSAGGTLSHTETRYSAACPAQVFYATQDHALVLRFPRHRVIVPLPEYARDGEWVAEYQVPDRFLVLRAKGMPIGEKIRAEVQEHPGLRQG
ncbi:MAG: hypothetical protein D6690_03185 [Nitrospirae bacterium]|nr:MAG: hypothetical protein D6690_03185 [Nitrospirota bacterium]